MPKHIQYPSIEQFRNAIHKVTTAARKSGVDANGDPVFDHTLILPVLTYEGTVKLHGTNAAIGMERGGIRSVAGFWFQSKETILTLENDNAGFVRHFHDKDLYRLFKGLVGDNIIVFGEWCGGNVQQNVALEQLSKRFVVFGAQSEGKWLSKDVVRQLKAEDIGIYNIYDYQTVSMDIDFNRPELSQNKLAELTVLVEKQCPVAAKHGVTGLGEGIVWKCVTPGWESPEFFFKVKGEKHSATKVKTLAAVDVELVASQREFAEKTVTESRCRQGIEKVKAAGHVMDRTSLGHFIKWILTDIEKEESDTAKASGLDFKKASGELTKAAKTWFFKNELSF